MLVSRVGGTMSYFDHALKVANFNVAMMALKWDRLRFSKGLASDTVWGLGEHEGHSKVFRQNKWGHSHYFLFPGADT